LSGETTRTALIATWCSLCGTQHAPNVACPREVRATGPEKPRWRVAAETPLGVRGYGVLVAEAGARWCARIVTFPNILWMVPGGGQALKFLAKTEEDAVRQASDFIRQHCVAKGYLMRDEVEFVEPVRRSVDLDGSKIFTGQPAPRFERRLPILFGHSRPTMPGRTGNLSETGLFVATAVPLSDGEALGLLLELEHCKVPLRGAVRWQRTRQSPGRECGMGLRLVNPPAIYLDYVRALG
jgi:hypothetical protein